jgi:hypothetical protein
VPIPVLACCLRLYWWVRRSSVLSDDAAEDLCSPQRGVERNHVRVVVERVRSLEATGRALALGTRPGANADLADLGLLDSDTASRALALSTVRHGIVLWRCALGRALHHTDEAHVAGVSRQGCAPRHIRGKRWRSRGHVLDERLDLRQRQLPGPFDRLASWST